ncbi:MAG: DUF58 domain-containing protein [Wenzhouxiangellaceae bacterium]
MSRRAAQSTPSAPAFDPLRVDLADLIRLQARAAKLPLRRSFRARAALAGQYQSRFRGRGVDYLESRHYLPGDDIRNMDWRVTARTGKAHTKVFQEERERPVVLVIDRNPSMFFATQGALKAVVAARLAALIAWSAVRGGDRIGGFVYGGSGHHELKPGGGRRGAMRLLRQLAQWLDPSTQAAAAATIEPLSDALERLRHVARPGTLVVLISDFYAQHEALERPLSRLRQHNDVIAWQVLDPIEASGLPQGVYPVSDGEHNRLLRLQSAQDLDLHQQQLASAYNTAPEILRRHGCACLRLLTSDDPVTMMSRSLHQLNGQTR